MNYSYSDRVRLDRYAIKDPNAVLMPGDLVVVSIQRKSPDGKPRESREIGVVVTNGATACVVEVAEQKAEVAGDVTVEQGAPGMQVLRNVPRHCLEYIVEKDWATICNRVGHAVLEVDKAPDAIEFAERVSKNMTEGKFIPAGRVLSGLGRADQHDLTVYNCYVFSIPGDSRAAITKHWGRIFDTFSRGGGVGWDLSVLRPKGAVVKKVNGRSSGVISWAEQFSQITGTVEQGGCFAGDTQIEISGDKDGWDSASAAALANLVDAGETIYATTHQGPRRITAAFRNGVKKLLRVSVSGHSVDVTPEHKMCVQDLTLLPAGELKLGQEVALLYWNWGTQKHEVRYLPVESITELNEQEVFDFEVEDVHLICGNGFYTSNSRRGAALMGLFCWHPDIFNFIDAKSLREDFEVNGQKISRNKNLLSNANVSVLITNAFMEAVKTDADWELVFPDLDDPEYDAVWTGDLAGWKALGKRVIVYRTLKARELWQRIVEKAWEAGEPGLLFIERANDLSNSSYFNRIACTNPCVTGETKVATELGDVAARDLVVGTKIWTPKGLKPITKVLNNGVQKIYKISFSDGGHLNATADHKLWILRAGVEAWVQTTDLVSGDAVQTWDGQTLHLTTEVLSVEDTGRSEEVFDVTEPETLTWFTNGYVSFDCGEIQLPPNGVCNLSHINLARFVRQTDRLPSGEVDFSEADYGFDWDKFYVSIQDGIRFLDDVIDLNKYHDEEIKKQQDGERRVGLGILGYGEMLMRLGLRYGSTEALKFTDRLFAKLWYKSYAASCALARERGPFPKWAPNFMESGFLKQAHVVKFEREQELTGTPSLLMGIQTYGMRNVTTNTVAPTGSVGSLLETTGGIEPYFDLQYTATTRIGTVEEKAGIVTLLSKQFGPESNWPSYVVTAQKGITPEQHVQTQAIAQKWVDASIAKTSNLPHNATVEDVAATYMMMWDLGCKGGTVYRDGSRDEQVFYAKTAPAAPASVPIDVSTHAIDAMRPRLEVGIGPTFSVPSPVGSLHVTIRHDPKTGDPEDIFITSGKGDITADVQAIGRLCSLILRLNGVPLSQQSKLELVREQLAGIPGRTQDGLPGQVRVSMPDTIAHVIERYLEGNFPLANMPFGAAQVDDLCKDFATMPQDTLGKLATYLKNQRASTPAPQHEEESHDGKLFMLDLCPKCGTMSYQITGGCGYCHACAYSRCG